MARTRLFFATDIHGSEACFLKFLNASRVYKADVMVLAGDLSGKLLIPIVERVDGSYESTFMGVRSVVSGEKLAELEERIRKVGSYPHSMSKPEYDELLSRPERANAIFEGLIRDRIVRWVNLAEERLGGPRLSTMSPAATTIIRGWMNYCGSPEPSSTGRGA